MPYDWKIGNIALEPGHTEGDTMSKKLGIGDAFPSMTIKLAAGGTIDLPGGMASKYGVILFYRGHW